MSFYRPTGRLAPAPADPAYGSRALAALESQARRGEIILLYEDATSLWRFALPRAGWWRKAQRARLPTRPLRQGQIKREESLKRHAWGQYRSWSRLTSGVLLSVRGAVQYGTSKVCYKIVPHCDAQALRPYIPQVMVTFRKTAQEVVMVVDRSGSHRAHKLDATLAPYHDKCRFHCLPARGGHHLNPSAGVWRVMKDTVGAGRCFGDLRQLYKRPRQVLMAHQERPIYAFHWQLIPPRTSRDLLLLLYHALAFCAPAFCADDLAMVSTLSHYKDICVNICVGNLAFSTTDHALRQLFEQYGTVDKVNIITDRDTGRPQGFGFVDMPDSRTAQAAIQGLHGKEFDGRTLNVNEAKPREPHRTPSQSRW